MRKLLLSLIVGIGLLFAIPTHAQAQAENIDANINTADRLANQAYLSERYADSDVDEMLIYCPPADYWISCDNFYGFFQDNTEDCGNLLEIAYSWLGQAMDEMVWLLQSWGIYSDYGFWAQMYLPSEYSYVVRIEESLANTESELYIIQEIGEDVYAERGH